LKVDNTHHFFESSNLRGCDGLHFFSCKTTFNSRRAHNKRRYVGHEYCYRMRRPIAQ
jgi:hypothetical protein